MCVFHYVLHGLHLLHTPQKTKPLKAGRKSEQTHKSLNIADVTAVLQGQKQEHSRNTKKSVTALYPQNFTFRNKEMVSFFLLV